MFIVSPTRGGRSSAESIENHTRLQTSALPRSKRRRPWRPLPVSARYVAIAKRSRIERSLESSSKWTHCLQDLNTSSDRCEFASSSPSVQIVGPVDDPSSSLLRNGQRESVPKSLHVGYVNGCTRRRLVLRRMQPTGLDRNLPQSLSARSCTSIPATERNDPLSQSGASRRRLFLPPAPARSVAHPAPAARRWRRVFSAMLLTTRAGRDAMHARVPIFQKKNDCRTCNPGCLRKGLRTQSALNGLALGVLALQFAPTGCGVRFRFGD